MSKVIFLLISAIIINICCPMAGFGVSSEFQLSDAELYYLDSIKSDPLTLAITAELSSFINEDGVRDGLLQPLISLLEDSWGLRVNTVNLGWEESFKKMDSNEVDLLGLVMLSEKRRSIYYSTDPLYNAHMDIYTRKDFPISSLIELNGKTIGLMSNSALPETLEVYLTPSGSIKYYKTVEELIGALELGEIDCAASALPIHIELLSHPELIYKTSSESMVIQQGVLSNNKRLEPLITLLNRYLKTPDGAALIAEISANRRKCVLEKYRNYYKDDIKYIQDNYDNLRVIDSDSLYPVSFMDNGRYRGLQNDLNDIFYELTGKEIEILKYSEFPSGADGVVLAIKEGSAVAAAGVYKTNEYSRDELLEYSTALMTDYLSFYSRQDNAVGSLVGMRIGSISAGGSYVDWESVAGESPVFFNNCADLVGAVKDNSIDAAFFGEMTTDYFYTVMHDYTLKRFGRISVPASVHMLYGSENESFNKIMDACIDLLAIAAPGNSDEQTWMANSQDVKFELMRLRGQLDDAQHRTVYITVLLTAFLSLLLMFAIYQLYKFRRFDKQISRMLSVQANADMIWGNIKTGKIISKGGYLIFKRLGMPDEDVGEFIGIQAFKSDIEKIDQQKLPFCQSDLSLQKSRSETGVYLRRFTHKIKDHEFMAYIIDITAEKYREQELSRLADTDFLTRLLNRRAIDRVLSEKASRAADNKKRIFIYMFDIDNFKHVNDSYGHDIGDQVLSELAGCILRLFEKECAARWGGEEFLTVAEHDDEEQAVCLAEAVRLEFASIKIHVGTRCVFSSTISGGVSELVAGEAYTNAIDRADKAMYQAKCEGKNRVKFLSADSDKSIESIAKLQDKRYCFTGGSARQRSDYDYALMNARAFSWIRSVQNETFVFTSDIRGILGYPDGYFDGTAKKMRTIIFPDDLPDAERSYVDFITGDITVFSTAYRVLAASGDIVWLRFEARFIDESRDIISGVAFDISEQKRMELKQQQLLEDLQTQKLKTSLAFESSRSFSWEAIPREDKLFLGQTVELAIGYPPDHFNNTLSAYMDIIDPDYVEYVERRRRDYLSGAISEYTTEYPLTTADGEIKWYLSRGTFVDKKKGLVCGVCMDITDTKRYEQRLSELAYKDSLTGLYNMQYLTDGLLSDSHETSDMRSLGAILIDIVDFKNVNDAFGYAYGDKLLANIAKTITSLIPDEPIIRISGDKFLVLAGNASAEELEAYSRKIISGFNEPSMTDEKLAGINVKIGIATSDGADVIQLLHDAEIALANVKNDDSEDCCVVDEFMKIAFEKVVNMKVDLRRAVRENEFFMCYQPKISTHTKKLVGAEALIRWNHPELGIVTPLEFIPLAEETGIIVQIGEYVINEVSRQLREWLDEGRDVLVSLNMSPKQFLSPRIKTQIMDAIERYRIPPDHLILEITESIMISDFDYIKELLNDLHSMGIGISLDDFGTGYSSMNYLGKMPLDYLKIDKSFIMNATSVVTDRAILESIITMAHKLKFQVVAEGVETGDQLAMLEEFDCDIIQGYLFSQPLAKKEFEEFMDIVDRYDNSL